MSQSNMDYHWMPFTNNQAFKADPQLFVRAEGIYYYSDRGEQGRSRLVSCERAYHVVVIHGCAIAPPAKSRRHRHYRQTTAGWPDC